MMWKRSLRDILLPICLLALLLIPAESLQIGGHKGGNLGDLVTASIIGLAIGGVRNRLKQQQEQKSFGPEQLKLSANNQHARFMPFPLMPLQQQFPIMQASQMLPSFQHQVLQPQPFMPDMMPMMMWSPEEAFAPMASQLMQSVLSQQSLHQLLSNNNPLQALSNNPMQGLSNNPMQGLSNNPLQALSNNPMQGLSNNPLQALSNNPMQGLSNNPLQALSNNPMQALSNSPLLALSNSPLLALSNNPLQALSNNPMQALSNNPLQALSNNPMQALSSNPIQTGFNGFDGLDDLSSIQQQWKALESQAIRTILAYGAQ